MASRVNRKPKLSAEEAELEGVLEMVREQFIQAEEVSHDERMEAKEARDYYDGKQWTDAEVAILKRRRQPASVDNKIKDKIEFMQGMERKTRTDPKCSPRNPGSDESQAEAATDALRFVCDDNQFNYLRSAFSEEIWIEGRGGVETICEKPRKADEQPKVRLKKIRYDRSYVDPHSRELDYSDKAYCGLIAWMDADAAKLEWPEHDDIIDASFEQRFINTDTYEDRPYFFHKTGRRKRVQVFQHYYLRGGKWWYCVFVAGGFLEQPRESNYIDFDSGEPECPYEFQALYREPETGRAYGMVRRYKDPQDEWNKRRSKALHLLNTNKIIGEKGFAGGVKDRETFRTEMQRPDGIVEIVPGLKFEVQDGSQLAQGHLNMMMMAGESLRSTGPNAALAGLSGDISGRAKEFDQQGGLVAIDYPFDTVRFLTFRCYRQVWNRIKQYWTAETWIRVRDEEHLKFTALNKKSTRGEMLAAEVGTMQIPDEEKAELLARIAADPENQKPLVLNDVAEIDVDITIDEVPDVVNIQAEQFDKLVRLVESGMVKIPPAALIEASQLRNKRKILEQMSGADDPMAQKMRELEVRVLELDAMVKEATAAKSMAQAKQAEATAEESTTDAAIKVAEFMTGDRAGTPAKKQVQVQ